MEKKQADTSCCQGAVFSASNLIFACRREWLHLRQGPGESVQAYKERLGPQFNFSKALVTSYTPVVHANVPPPPPPPLQGMVRCS